MYDQPLKFEVLVQNVWCSELQSVQKSVMFKKHLKIQVPYFQLYHNLLSLWGTFVVFLHSEHHTQCRVLCSVQNFVHDGEVLKTSKCLHNC